MMSSIEARFRALTLAQVDRQAADARRRHRLGATRTNLEALALSAGVAIQPARFRDSKLAGGIIRRGDEVTILVEVTDSPSRRRWTIAHELGHHFLHLRDDGEFFDRATNLARWGNPATAGPDRPEIQANLFAAALLMPRASLQRRWRRCPSTRHLARVFGVPRDFLSARVVALGLD